MNFNVRDVFIIIALLIYAVPSNANDWRGTPWEIIEKGACYPSPETFMESTFGDNYLDDNNISISILSKNTKEIYYVAGDFTPSRGASLLILHKEKNSEICLIAYLLGGGDSDNYKFSDDGVLIEIRTSSYTYQKDFFNNEIVYKPNNEGRFFPSECAMTGNNKKQPYDCFEAYRPDVPIRVPPSFDCSNPKKLNNSESLVCKDGDLAELDSVLASNYKALRAADIGALREKLIQDQREWMKRRDKCADDKDSKGCLANEYSWRITEICTKYPVVSGSKPPCKEME